MMNERSDMNEYFNQARGLNNFIPLDSGETMRSEGKLFTVLREGEEMIGVEDGCLITNQRVIDSRDIKDRPRLVPVYFEEADNRDPVIATPAGREAIRDIISILHNKALIVNFFNPDHTGWSGT